MKNKKTYKAEVKVVGDEKWYSNALIFESREKAEVYAKDLFSRWSSTTDWRVVTKESE